MVSSSLDKNIKKSLIKDNLTCPSDQNSGTIKHTANNSNTASCSSSSVGGLKTTASKNTLGGDSLPLPPSEKIQLLFPKCKPRTEINNYTTSSTTTLHQQQQHQQHQQQLTTSQSIPSLFNTTPQVNCSNNSHLLKSSSKNSNNNNFKQMKQSTLSPDHKINSNNSKYHHQQQQQQQQQHPVPVSYNDQKQDYVETNPFRIGSNNRYFYSNDSLYMPPPPTSSSSSSIQQLPPTNSSSSNNNMNNNGSNLPSGASNNSMMHHYHYPPSYHQSAYAESRNFYMEPDEIEHNPYMDTQPKAMTQIMNTIPSSILKTTPPATPPALTTTPVNMSPIMGTSSRNMWDLSPIKTTTPTRIKSQSPTSLYSRSHKGSYKKILASPVPIEEDLETGHYYYNNKKNYYQPPQTDSDSNEPVVFNDIQEPVDKDFKVKPKSFFSKTKMKHSETSDGIYAEVKKKEERKMVKSKSGSGIIEYDGSPRRFGMSSSEDVEYYSPSNYKFNVTSPSIMPSTNFSIPSPPRPGFPQRILSFDQQNCAKSPAVVIPKSYSFDDQIPASYVPITTTSTLIPTTFIQSNAYDLPEEDLQPEEEEEDEDDDEDEVLEEIPMTLEDLQPQTIPEQIELDDSNYDLNTLDCASALQASSPTAHIPTSTFDYLYEFSETRKVLEEFFKCPVDEPKSFEKFSDFNESDGESLDIKYDYRGQIEKEMESMYLANNNNNKSLQSPIKKEEDIDDDNRDDHEDDDDDVDDDDDNTFVKTQTQQNGYGQHEINHQHEMKENNNQFDYYLDSASRSSNGEENVDREHDIDAINNSRNSRMSKHHNNNNNSSNYNNTARRQSKNFHYSPDTTDYDSNYGDFDSESSLRFLATEYPVVPTVNSTGAPSATVDLNSGGPVNNYARFCTSMPVLEDGLSSGHASDTENNNPIPITTASNDYSFMTKRNSIQSTNNNGTSTASGLHNQYQDNLVQTNNTNNNIFYNNKSTNLMNNNGIVDELDEKPQSPLQQHQQPPQTNYHSFYPMRYDSKDPTTNAVNNLMNNKIFKNRDPELDALYTINTIQLTPPPPAPVPHRQSMPDAQILTSPPKSETDIQAALKDIRTTLQRTKALNNNPTPASTPVYSNNSNIINNNYYDRTPVIPEKVESPAMSLSPVWIPRSRDKTVHSPVTVETGLLAKHKNMSGDEEDEEDVDTDLETDRLLGHQMLDDGFYDDKMWSERKQHRPLMSSKISPKINQTIPKSSSSSLLRHGLNQLLPTSTSAECCTNSNTLTTSPLIPQQPSLKSSPSLNSGNMINLIHPNATTPDRHSDNPSPRKLEDLPEQLEELQQSPQAQQCIETADLCNLDIEEEIVDSPGGSSSNKSKKDTASINGDKKKKNKNKEVLIEGVLFRARYLGSTQLVCEGQPTKSTRMMQAEEAVSRIKALSPDGENQPSTEVDLFISTEKIMVLNTDLKEIMMDHALRTISYIADIGDLVVLMARRRFVPQDVEGNSDSGTGTGGSGNNSGGSGGPTPPTSGKINRTPKMICHVFESEEAQFIAQSIGQAFQVAYMEFLKANGIEDHSFMKEMDYQEVLNSQEIFGDELEIFAKKELQKEVVVPKAKGEILGVVIVESGWGSMLPTVVIANLASTGAAARCGQLNIGDQIIAINGLSLVGLPLSQCQTYIKNTKSQTVVKFTVVPCAPVVEVKIKRPNTKYQLGFSVQNGVICSLLRGGIAERGGVRVGHRIIEINNQSVVAVPHEKIVNLLATSVGEILMKTMPTSMFRLLTGQENPIYI